MVDMLPKGGDQRPVIPKRPILFPDKPLERFQTISSKGSQDRARVMQFIGSRHQPCRRIGILEMLEVSSFSFQPRRLWCMIRVVVTFNDPDDIIAIYFLDIAQLLR